METIDQIVDGLSVNVPHVIAYWPDGQWCYHKPGYTKYTPGYTIDTITADHELDDEEIDHCVDILIARKRSLTAHAAHIGS